MYMTAISHNSYVCMYICLCTLLTNFSVDIAGVAPTHLLLLLRKCSGGCASHRVRQLSGGSAHQLYPPHFEVRYRISGTTTQTTSKTTKAK